MVLLRMIGEEPALKIPSRLPAIVFPSITGEELRFRMPALPELLATTLPVIVGEESSFMMPRMAFAVIVFSRMTGVEKMLWIPVPPPVIVKPEMVTWVRWSTTMTSAGGGGGRKGGAHGPP